MNHPVETKSSMCVYFSSFDPPGESSSDANSGGITYLLSTRKCPTVPWKRPIYLWLLGCGEIFCDLEEKKGGLKVGRGGAMAEFGCIVLQSCK